MLWLTPEEFENNISECFVMYIVPHKHDPVDLSVMICLCTFLHFIWHWFSSTKFMSALYYVPWIQQHVVPCGYCAETICVCTHRFAEQSTICKINIVPSKTCLFINQPPRQRIAFHYLRESLQEIFKRDIQDVSLTRNPDVIFKDAWTFYGWSVRYVWHGIQLWWIVFTDVWHEYSFFLSVFIWHVSNVATFLTSDTNT